MIKAIIGIRKNHMSDYGGIESDEPQWSSVEDILLMR
jgi:hypothetical protein